MAQIQKQNNSFVHIKEVLNEVIETLKKTRRKHPAKNNKQPDSNHLQPRQTKRDHTGQDTGDYSTDL